MITDKDYPRAFISYSHEDKELALELGKRLAKDGVEPWIDAWEIGAGDSLIEKVFEEGLKDCSVFIILLSPASVQSPWVKQELDVAVVSRIRRLTRVIPVIAEECEIPVALRALRWTSVKKDGIEAVVREIVDAAYERSPKKPLVQAPPDRVRRFIPPRFGLSQEATTVGAAIVSDLDMSQRSRPLYEGQSLRSDLDLTAEQINDAVEELAAHGLVKVYKFLGTAPFNFGQIEPTYALYYTFAEYLKDRFDPDEDIRHIAGAIASHEKADGELLSKVLNLPPTRVNFAVAYLADYGVIRIHKALGTTPYDFNFATATGATRHFVKEH